MLCSVLFCIFLVYSMIRISSAYSCLKIGFHCIYLYRSSSVSEVMMLLYDKNAYHISLYCHIPDDHLC